MNKNKIIVLQGPPASGKTTLAHKIYNINPQIYVIVSRDSIRESRGNYWVLEQEEYITDLEIYSVKCAISRNLIPIIDATNLNPSTIERWEKLAEELNVEIEFKLLYVPFKEALERDSKRDRPVGKDVLKWFYLKYFEEEFRKECYTDHTFILQQDKTLPSAIIIDLDGTIALHTGRGPFEWDKIYTDILDVRTYDLIITLINSGVYPIFLTGRNSTKVAEQQTKEWLNKYFKCPYKLVMRNEDDFRSSEITKRELYEEYVKHKYNVLCVFDDSNKCIEMWRNLGLLCCAVANNNY